ncbi:hypothetical protein IWQ56_001517, partial [Coemansia nantahalensis]
AYKGKVVLITFGVVVVSILLFGLISTVIPSSMTIQYNDILDMCYYDKGYVAAVIVIIWCIWLYTAYMNWRMRNIAFCFNERAEIVTLFAIMLMVVVMNTLCLFAVNVYPASLGWRTALLYVNHVGASTGYWIVMFEPTYNCLFNREEYLRYWIAILKEDQMEREYGYSADMNNNETTIAWGDFSEIPSKVGSKCPSTHTAVIDLTNDATIHVPAEAEAQSDIFEREHRKHEF